MLLKSQGHRRQYCLPNSGGRQASSITHLHACHIGCRSCRANTSKKDNPNIYEPLFELSKSMSLVIQLTLHAADTRQINDANFSILFASGTMCFVVFIVPENSLGKLCQHGTNSMTIAKTPKNRPTEMYLFKSLAYFTYA